MRGGVERGEGYRGGWGKAAIRSCLCLSVSLFSHTVEINLPSGLSLWNKERRKLARFGHTQREKKEMEKERHKTQGNKKAELRRCGQGLE